MKKWKDVHPVMMMDPRTKVCIVRDNGVQWLEEFLAAQRLYKSVVLLSPKMPVSILQSKIRSMGPSVLVCADDPKLMTGQPPALLYSHHESSLLTNDGSITLVTSGSSSGMSRQEVVLPTSCLQANLDQINTVVDKGMMDGDDVSLSILPWSHCYGLVCELLCLVHRGGSLFLPEGHPVKDVMREAKPTLLFVVPFVLQRLLERLGSLKRVACSSNGWWTSLGGGTVLNRMCFGGRLRNISVGGACSDTEMLQGFQEAFGTKIYEGYGMTETSPMVSLNTNLAYKLGSVGQPLPGVEVQIDPETEEILVRGKNVVQNLDPDRYLTIDHKRFYRTGDRGRIDDQGFLFVVDRLKDHFKLNNGLFIYPVRIEEVFNRFLPRHIQQWIVVQDPRPGRGSQLILVGFIMEKTVDNIHHLTPEELEKIGRSGNLMTYEIPKTVYYLTPTETVDMFTEKQTPRRAMIREHILRQVSKK